MEKGLFPHAIRVLCMMEKFVKLALFVSTTVLIVKEYLRKYKGPFSSISSYRAFLWGETDREALQPDKGRRFQEGTLLPFVFFIGHSTEILVQVLLQLALIQLQHIRL